MLRKIFLTALSACLVLSLTACNIVLSQATVGSTAGPAGTTATTTIGDPSGTTGAPAELTWSYIDYNRTFLAADNTVVLTLNCHFPHLTPESNPIAIEINSYYDQQTEAIDEAAVNLATEASTAYEANSSFFMAWSEEHTSDVVWTHDMYASIVTLISINSGGAHPATSQRAEVFDLQTGWLTPMTHFFTIDEDGIIWLIADIVIDMAMGDGIATTPEALRANLYLDNYYLTDDGMVVFYQPYDIAPGAYGVPQFTIPYVQFAGNSQNIDWVS